MSASYRLKKPDRRFEELKTYSNDIQNHITSILRIRAVSIRQEVVNYVMVEESSVIEHLPFLLKGGETQRRRHQKFKMGVSVAP